jgi:hypothetical protein
MTTIRVRRLPPRLRRLIGVVALLARCATTAAVSLNAVVGELELLGEEMHAFVNRRTGELYGSTSELLHKAAEGDDDELLGWEGEVVDKLREILGSADWLELPARETSEDYRIMERFCLECCAGRVQEELLSAISGRGAFGRFKDGIHRWQVQDEWYAFRQRALAESAARWLEAQGIAYGP